MIEYSSYFVSGIFSQSNFGIMTKMGVTSMPNPGGHESFISFVCCFVR